MTKQINKTFYVYRHKADRRGYPHNWTLSSTHTTYEAANAAARKLCARIQTIYTEPRDGMKEAFFGPMYGNGGWRAMIDTKDIHAGRK